MASFISKSAIYLGFFVALTIISSASALKCYQCNSEESTKCSYSITSFLYDTVECSSSAFGFLSPQCFKVTAKTKAGKDVVARGCIDAGGFACNAALKAVGAFSSFSNDPNAFEDLNCVTCDTDKCNSANQVTIGSLTLFGLALASFFFLI